MKKIFTHSASWRTNSIHVAAIVGSITVIAIISFFSFIYIQCTFPIMKLSWATEVSKNTCSLYANNFIENNVLGAQNQNTSGDISTLEKSRDYWLQTITTHPDYEDAYVQLIILSYQLKNNEGVRRYINALTIQNPIHSQLNLLIKLLDNDK